MQKSDYRRFLDHSRTPEYRKKEQQMLDITSDAIRAYKPYVAFSGGKDSTVMLHAVCRYKPLPVVIYDLDAYMPRQYQAEIEELAYKLGAIDVRILTQRDDFLKDMEQYVKDELSKEFNMSLVGIRSGENPRRKIRVKYNIAIMGMKEMHPVGYMSNIDIWSYIVKHKVPYHSHYDRRSISTPIEDVRFGSFFDLGRANIGAEILDAFYDFKQLYHWD